MNILEILTQLETTVKKGPKVMGRSMVDADQVAALVVELRDALPQDLEKAHEVLQQREGLLNQALAEASSIRAQAEQEMNQRIERSPDSAEAHKRAEDIVKAAEKRAQEVMGNADRQAKRVQADAESFAQERTRGADEYAHSVLLHLEEEISQLLGSVRKGIDAINQQREVRA
jgi:cell division septum initiation protein DivIVA